MKRRLRAVLVVGVLACVTGAGAEPLDRVQELLETGRLQEAQAAARTLAHEGDHRAQETLASMLLRGIGSAPDREQAMGWLCLRAHAPQGGRAVTQALWLLAEYFRTGGGLPGRRYDDGDRALENPVKAYFWFQVMAQQERYYREPVADAARLGKLGAGTLRGQLTEGERQQVERRLESWSPDRAPRSPARCLDLPLA